ncbi:helix-turn-helix domain-containing protein [Streptomyces xiamenensis]|uniref:helix-turn-helix domain-containing protein n=1 Tax=Streptomyces xiamenensis TaxID=408015 RepID=UPI0035DE7FB7
MAYTPAPLLRAATALGDRSAADMARRLDVPYLAVYRWITGRAAPSSAGLAAIERAYGLTPADQYRDAA